MAWNNISVPDGYTQPVADELPKGTHVHEGQTIGHVGNTGASTWNKTFKVPVV